MKDFIKGAAPVLPCKDVNETLEYYKEKLGFDKTWMHQDFYGGAYNGASEFHFQKVQGHFVMPVTVYCFVDNVDELFEFVKANGVELTNEPSDQPYGLRDFTIRDLNSNIISFGTMLKK